MSEEFFSKQELKELKIDEDIINIITKDINQQQSKIQQIQTLGKNLQNQITQYIVIRENKTRGAAVGIKDYVYDKIGEEGKEKQVQSILKVATIFLFKLRTFLLNEQINFKIGGIFQDDNFQEYLGEYNISQEDMYKIIIADLSSKAIEIDSNLKKEKFGEKASKVDDIISELWFKILELTDVSSFVYSPLQKPDEVIDGRQYYRNKQQDFSVYVNYKQGKEHLKYRYYRKMGKMIFFNDGWLYEWFKTYLADNNEHVKKLKNSIDKGSIEPMIYKMDSVPGIKGGDYKENNIDIQAKYGNSKIITFTSVITNIIKINKLLDEYQNTNKQKKIAENLWYKFVDKNQDRLKENVTNSVSNIINILNEL